MNFGYDVFRMISCSLTFRQIAASRQRQASWMKEILHGKSPVATKLLNYVWTNWDHPVEVCRTREKNYVLAVLWLYQNAIMCR